VHYTLYTILIGLLCRPAVQYPALFEGTLLDTYPYLLPSLASSFFAGVGFVITLCLLPEQPIAATAVTAKANSAASEATAPDTAADIAEDTAATPARDQDSDQDSSTVPPKAAEQGIWAYILRHPRCRSVFCIVFCIYFLDYGMFEIYPLWAITTIEEGGLGWEPAQIALTQVVGGFFLLVL
jgi:hypothetical protein